MKTMKTYRLVMLYIASLLPVSSFAADWNTREFSTSETISLTEDVAVKGTITIKSGATITINNAKDSNHLWFYEAREGFEIGPMFVIEQGGKLILNGKSGSQLVVLEGNDGFSDGHHMITKGGKEYFYLSPFPGESDPKPNKKYSTAPIKCYGGLEFNFVNVQGNYNGYFYDEGASTENVGIINFSGPAVNAKFSSCCFLYNFSSTGAACALSVGCDGTVEFDNCSIMKNCGHTMTINPGGSAIRSWGDTKATLKLNNVKLYNNYSEGNGGAIYWSGYEDDAILIMKDCDIHDNYSTLSGGGALLEGRSEFQGTNLFHDNLAERNGGGLSVEGYSKPFMVGEPAAIIDFNFNSGLSVYNNVSPAGAGIGINLRSSVGYPAKSTVNININGSTIKDNFANQDYEMGDKHLCGGGIFITNNLMEGRQYVVNAVLNGCKITGNTAGIGAGVYVENANVIAQGSGLDISANESSVSSDKLLETSIVPAEWNCGGGVCVKGGNLSLNGGTVANNTAPVNGGGAVVLNLSEQKKGSISVDGAIVRQNTAVLGGGLYLQNGEVNVVSGNVGMQNYANIAQRGAGVYVEDGIFKISGASGYVSYNEASEYGGGVYLSKGQVQIINGNVSYNKANSGAGFYVENGTTDIKGGSVSFNAATTYGGGMFSQQGGVTITGGNILHNTASLGGGLFVGGGITEIMGGSISYNEVEHGGGGVYINTNGSLTVKDASTEIANNKAEKGGGLFVHKGGLELEDATIKANEATECGGGIIIEYGTVSFKSGRVCENKSKQGGGMYLCYGADMLFTDGLIARNRAIQNENIIKTAYDAKASVAEVNGCGGGVYLQSGFADDPTTLTINVVNSFGLYGNTADRAGDDIVAEGVNTSVTVPNVTAMDLKDFEGKDAQPNWYEDYVYVEGGSDSGYSGHSILKYSGGSGKRFKDMLADGTGEYANHLVSFAESSKSFPSAGQDNGYVCLSLGYEVIDVIVRVTGLNDKEGICFNLQRYKKSGDAWVLAAEYPVFVSGVTNDEGYVQRVVRNQLPGQFDVQQLKTAGASDQWAWAYTVTAPAVSDISPEIGRYYQYVSDDKHVFEFTVEHNHGDDVPLHDEEYKVNEFKIRSIGTEVDEWEKENRKLK